MERSNKEDEVMAGQVDAMIHHRKAAPIAWSLTDGRSSEGRGSRGGQKRHSIGRKKELQ
jgi:hypothetical protein